MKDSNTTRTSSLQKLLDQDKRLLRLTKPGNPKADFFFNEKGGLNFYMGTGVLSGNTNLKEDEETSSFYMTEDGWPIPQEQAEKILETRINLPFTHYFTAVDIGDKLLKITNRTSEIIYENSDLNSAAEGSGIVARIFSVGKGVYNSSQAAPEERGKVIMQEMRRLFGERLGEVIGNHLAMAFTASAFAAKTLTPTGTLNASPPNPYIVAAGTLAAITSEIGISEAIGTLFKNLDPAPLGEGLLNLYNNSGESPLYRAPEPSASQQNTFLTPDGWEITAPPPVYNLQLSMDGLIGQVNVYKSEDSQELAAEVAGLVARNVQAALNNYAC